MTIARAECIRAGFLEWHTGSLKRRMEKMEMEKEAQHLKAAKARSTCEVFIMMKMLETQVGQLVGRPMGNKEEFRRQLQGPKTAKGYSNSLGRDEDHNRRPGFEMPSHKEVVASVKTKGQSQPVKTKKMTKPKWVPKIATPAKSVDPE
jgi:hypothetical protein